MLSPRILASVSLLTRCFMVKTDECGQGMKSGWGATVWGPASSSFLF